MSQLFVPYEIASRLKEKGFDEDCFGAYGNLADDLDIEMGIVKEPIFELTTFYNKVENKCKYAVSAPLYQQVINWFDEKHGIDISVQRRSGFYWYEVATVEKIISPLGSNAYTRYEAYDKAINEALNYIS